MFSVTIRTKLILAYTMLFGVVLTLFAVLIYQTVKDQRISKLHANLESQAEKLHSEIEEQLHRKIFPVSADLRIIKTQGLVGDRFQLYDLSGNLVIGDSLLEPTKSDFPSKAERAMPVREVYALQGEPYAAQWVPLEVDGVIRYVLEVAASTVEIESDLARLRLLLFLCVPLTLLVSGTIAALITRRGFRPIFDMAETAEKISASNLKERVSLPPARDEIYRLATTLNNMIGRIDAAFESQKSFIADASHELRTPLTVVRSELEFAQRTVADASVRESLRISLAEIDHLARMAEGLLLLAKMDGSQFKLDVRPVRVDELVVECVQIMKAAAETKGVSLDVHIDEAIEIPADGTRLKSVVLNLLDNAIKFSPRGSSVLCSVIMGTPTMAISVRDNGSGIPNHELPHVFKRFYQSENVRTAGNGSGIGLAIVQRIVELHHGSIEVLSEPGSGSTFIVHLPRHLFSVSPS